MVDVAGRVVGRSAGMFAREHVAIGSEGMICQRMGKVNERCCMQG